MLHRTLTLDRDVRAMPALAARPGFERDRLGHYRTAYSIVLAIEAAGPGWLLDHLHLVNLDQPMALDLIAALTASLFTAAAVALVFLTLARTLSRPLALVAALGLGLGSNLWALASQTLWEHETVSFGAALALYAWLRPAQDIRGRDVLIGGLGLALAGSARPQVTPMLLVLLVGLVVRLGWRRAAPAALVLASVGLALMALDWTWFGALLGGASRLATISGHVHDVGGSISHAPWVGAAGLLVSPSRGLVVFSPVMLVALAGVPRALAAQRDLGGRWFLAAALVQFVGYSCYSVWWGGHTFGPRYTLDVLIPLMTAAGAGVEWVAARPWRRRVAVAALVWSVVVAATGAFDYPNDRWNTGPVDVDTDHARLWDWRDSRIVRCWKRGLSPQDFELFKDARMIRRG